MPPVLVAVLLALAPAADPAPQQGKYFKIAVLDEDTGRGVPLVELETTNHLRYVTDSNGLVAFYEPGLMGQSVFFHVRSHGYEFPKDGFGFRGKALDVQEGGSAQLKVKRTNVAERLYRVTGGGIYADSLLLGEPTPLKHPTLDAQVFGSDSVVNAVYRGKLYWFWGDTNRPAYPLGNFDVPGATCPLPTDGTDPEKGIDLDYFTDDKGFAKPTARMPGEGPTWIVSLVVLRERKRERLFASYVKVRKAMEIYQRGLAEWDDDKDQFVKVTAFDLDAPLHPGGHPFLHTVDGVEYVYFASPYPLVRVRADPERLKKPEEYEAFTCLKEGTRLDKPEIDRYGWKKNTPAVGPAEQAKLVKSGVLKPEEALLQLTDVETGKPVTLHGGSVHRNEYRGRWVMIAVQSGGTSFLGEVWYAEADTPLGPWVYARKVVTHDKYSFYNPKQHPEFDKDRGRVIFFEGTYTSSFSGNTDSTPRYDYNQVLYKLDLSDPRLALPVPVYALSDADAPDRFGIVRDLKPTQPRRPAFLALDRAVKGTVAVYAWEEKGAGWRLRAGDPPTLPDGAKPEPVFHAWPADAKDPPPGAVPLYEYVHRDGQHRAYLADAGWKRSGFERTKEPLCLIRANPGRISLPGE
jgi:hypothetical protein